MLINDIIYAGQIVPVEITLGLLQRVSCMAHGDGTGTD